MPFGKKITSVQWARQNGLYNFFMLYDDGVKMPRFTNVVTT